MKPAKHGYPRRRGLTNDGNTCYLNSVIQILTASIDVGRTFLKFRLADRLPPVPNHQEVGICGFCATDASRRRSSWDSLRLVFPPLLIQGLEDAPNLNWLAMSWNVSQGRSRATSEVFPKNSWRFNLGILTVAEHGSQLYSQSPICLFSQPDCVFSN